MRIFIFGIVASLFIFLGATSAFCAIRATLLLEHAESSPWTELLKSGFERGGKDFGMETRIVVLPPGPEQRKGFQEAAGSSDLVILASDNLHEALRDNAASFRRVKFGSIDAGIRAPNIMSVTFADEQASFLAGVAAAMYARKNGKPGAIGWLAGEDTPAMRSLYNGYLEGAKLADPGIKVIQAVVGSFTDNDSAAAKAAWLRDNGAEVIALAAGAATPAAAAALPDTRIIALDKARPGAFGAISKAADKAVYEIMESMASGKFRGKEIIIYDLANGGTDFGDLDPAVATPDILRRIKELRHELANGSIRLKSLRARTLCDCLD